MRILVTGGAGFIGSWTVEALCRGAHDVCVYDSFSTGRHDYLQAASGAVEIVEGDVRHTLALQRVVRRFKPHAIVHLAACVSVPLSSRRALHSHDVNTRGTVAVLEAARANGVKRVVLASSAAVYGCNDDVPLREDSALDPLSPYALHKRMAEEYARIYTNLYGLDTVALRYFNVYGPRQDAASPYSGVITHFVAAAQRRRPICISGDGTQTRDFVFVADVAQATATAATATLKGHHVFNVGTGHETSLLALRDTIERITGKPLLGTFAPPRPGDVYRSCADVSALDRRLHLRCATSLHDGLARLLSASATPSDRLPGAFGCDSARASGIRRTS